MPKSVSVASPAACVFSASEVSTCLSSGAAATSWAASATAGAVYVNGA